MIDLDAIRKRLAETAGSTPGPWRLAKRHTMSAPHVAIVADGDTGWDDPINIGGYGGHLVAESVHKTNRALLLEAPQLRKDAAAMADELEALRCLLAECRRLVDIPDAYMSKSERAELLANIDKAMEQA